MRQERDVCKEIQIYTYQIKKKSEKAKEIGKKHLRAWENE